MAIKKNKDDIKLPPPAVPQMTEQELREFDASLLPFWIEKEITYPRRDKIRLLDLERLMVAKGAKSPQGGVYVPGDGTLPMYVILNAKLEQWHKWRGRQEFGRLKGLEETARLAGVLSKDLAVPDFHHDEEA